MPRGGVRKPATPSGPSGPGRFSRRTDGQQIATPNLGGGDSGESSLQYGDISQLRDAQKIAPLPVGTPAPRGAPTRRLTGQQTVPGRTIPRHLLEMPPENNEPTTTGLETGPGAGPESLQAPTPAPDEREAVLQFLAVTFGNETAAKMLAQLRAERQATMQAPVVPGGAPGAPGGAMPAPGGVA
jgi:hypothetical protein